MATDNHANQDGRLARLTLAVRNTLRWGRYSFFRITRPGTSYADYYAWLTRRQLARGHSHMALRTADTSEGKKFNAKSTALAEDVCALLRRFGLERHHTCVDYGCGSLRIGAKLIEFLDPDRYVGLDVTDIFFTAGLDDLGPEIRLTKRPTLQLINQDSLRDLRSTPPEFLFSFAVIQHVPPSELAGFLDSFVSLIGPRTTAILFFKASSRVLHYKEASWSYPPSLLIEAVQARQPAIPISMHTEEWSKIQHTFRGYSFLELNSGS